MGKAFLLAATGCNGKLSQYLLHNISLSCWSNLMTEWCNGYVPSLFKMIMMTHTQHIPMTMLTAMLANAMHAKCHGDLECSYCFRLLRLECLCWSVAVGLAKWLCQTQLTRCCGYCTSARHERKIVKLSTHGANLMQMPRLLGWEEM